MALVAKSYQSLEQVGEVYSVNNKQYIKVRTKDGNLKQVKAYTEAEYAKYYGTVPEETVKTPWSPKEPLGFKNGFITLYKGNTYENLDFFKLAKTCRYAVRFGWYTVSTEEVPSDLPEGITPVKLFWEQVSSDGEHLNSEEEIAEVVNSLIFEPSNSEWIGEEGDKVDLMVTVRSVRVFDNMYGAQICYNFVDDNENVLVWFTSASSKTSFEEEEEYVHLKGTIKKNQTYKNEKQTLLTRCSRGK